MLNRTVRRAASLGPPVAALPCVACAEPLSALGVLQHANPVVQAIVVGLVLATLAALLVCGLKLAQGPRLAGGSAFLAGLRLGGPLAGLVGAAYNGLVMAIGLANRTGPAPLQVLAPGLAEVMLLILLGLVSGAVAVIANWAVEARIDRAVLSD